MILNIVVCILFLWLLALTYCFKVITDSHEQLLYYLRDRLNELDWRNGHIYCTDVGSDGDFSCPEFKAKEAKE